MKEYSGKTLASLVVVCERESIVTETLITAYCVVTDLITSSIVLKTFIDVYSDVHKTHCIHYSS